MKLSLEISGLSIDWLRGLFRRREPMGYEGGRVNRTDPDFVPMQIGPNALADQTLDLVRRRTRWLGDNHPLVAGMKATYIANVAAETGVMIRPATRWPELNKALEERWYAREDAVDPGREQSCRDRQVEYLGEVFDAGDCLVHFPAAEAFRGVPAGPAIELIPAEQLDLMLNEPAMRTSGGNRVRQGVEFDAKGRRVAYHVLKQHPSDGWFGMGLAGETRRIPADNARLGFLARRPGMVRGVPMVVSVLQTIRLEAQYQDAFLNLAIAAACLGLYFKGAPPNSKLTAALQQYGVVDANGRPIKRIEPGIVGFLSANMDLVAQSPNIPGPTFQATLEMLTRLCGAGVGMGYADATRDESKTTFSASRAESLKNRKLYRPAQVFVYHTLVRPFYRRCVAWDIASGAVPLTAEQRALWLTNPEAIYACDGIYPGWEWVNPQQEAQAAEIELGLGTQSGPAICAQRGRHYQDVIDEQLAFEVYERQRRQELGLPPRQAAPVRPAAPDEDKPGKDEPGKDDEDKKAAFGGRLARLNGNGVVHA